MGTTLLVLRQSIDEKYAQFLLILLNSVGLVILKRERENQRPACGDQLSVEGCDWRGGKRGCDERTRSATRQGPHKGVQRRRLHAKFSLTLS